MRIKAIWVVLALALALRLLYLFAVPPLYAVDEYLHHENIRYVVYEREPVKNIEYLFPERYEGLPGWSQSYSGGESFQPPLYYLAAASVPRLFWFLRPEQLFLLLRFVNVLLSLAAVYLVYAVSLRLFPGRERLALVSSGFAALMPLHAFVSASITNIVLSWVLFGLFLYGLFAFRGENARQAMLALGVLGGLASLTRLFSLAFAPLLLFHFRRKGLRRAATGVILGLLLFAFMPLWHYLSYGVPFLGSQQIRDSSIIFPPPLADIAHFWVTYFWAYPSIYNLNPLDAWLLLPGAVFLALAAYSLLSRLYLHRQSLSLSQQTAFLATGLGFLVTWLVGSFIGPAYVDPRHFFQFFPVALPLTAHAVSYRLGRGRYGLAPAIALYLLLLSYLYLVGDKFCCR